MAIRCMLATQDGGYRAALTELSPEQLPSHEVLVEVAYSSLNYKDALAVTGKGKIVRKFPMVLGIDLAGTVIESRSAEFAPGDRVVAVGQGLGELEFGGYSQRQRVRAASLVKLPTGVSPKQAMALGTAGFTAMLCVIALENAGVKPGGKEVVVTGSTGGVGSIAVMLLSRLGFPVLAVTGRPEHEAYLRGLGASGILPREALSQKPPAMGPEKWAGAIDTVGGVALASLIAHTQSFGAVAACGMAAGNELTTSVFPFILRNVSLLGINSTQTPMPLAREAWRRLGELVPADRLEALSKVEPMSKLHELSERLLGGREHGRVVIDVNA
jgi:acrylyl-CoA reductase (NADPH)